MRRSAAIACATLAILTAAGEGAAWGSHSIFERASVGAINGNDALPTQFAGASADGTRVFLRSEEALAASDTDPSFDLYERAGAVTTHLSIGPSGGNTTGVEAAWRGASADGKRVFFEVVENLVAGDTDDCDAENPGPNPCRDVYEAAGGGVTLVSTGPGANGPFSARFVGASEDGTRVLFSTQEPLSPSDTDEQSDIYQRAGTTTLLSTGPAGGNGSFESSFRGASADATRVFITTAERLVSGDTDSSVDVYQRSGATTTLVSTGPAGGNGAAGASFEGTSRDGTKAFFSTTEHLVSADTDSNRDVYEREGGTTRLVSTGPAGGNGAHDAEFRIVSDGGTRVLFETAERLVAGDTDSAVDVYERAGGATTLVSTGPTGGNGAADSRFQGASADASRVVIGTTESLVGSDTDGIFDLYERAGGTTVLVSTGPDGGNGAFEAFFAHMSDDGRRIVFETLEPLASDTDALPDVYERANGATTKLSNGAGGGNGVFIAVFLGASDDGSRVFFNSAEQLAAGDTDTASDVYVARTTDAYVRPRGATPLSLPLVVAFRECTSPNRFHASPDLGGTTIHPSCNPPLQASDHLTVGTFDANQRAVQSKGSVSLRVATGNPSTPADEADVRLRLQMTDVRRSDTLDDYTGELGVSVDTRITDRESGSVAGDAATVVVLPFEFVASCAATADTGIGSTCSADTSADAVVPGVIAEGFRSNWELGRVAVYDGGSDGDASTPSNTLFLVQGIFIP